MCILSSVLSLRLRVFCLPPSLRPQIGRGHWAYGESQMVLILLLCGKVCYLNFLKYAFFNTFHSRKDSSLFFLLFLSHQNPMEKNQFFKSPDIDEGTRLQRSWLPEAKNRILNYTSVWVQIQFLPQLQILKHPPASCWREKNLEEVWLCPGC